MTLLIDTYAWANRWRNRHPGEKAFFALAMLSLAFIMPAAGLFLVLLIVSGAAIAGARIPWKVYVAVMAGPATFAAVSSVTLLFGISADRGLHLVFLRAQLEPAWRLTLRTITASSGLIFFALTTPVADWLPLLKQLGVPPVVRDMILTLHRLLSLFMEHLAAMKMAHTARLGYASASNTLRTSGLMAANLLARTLASARRLETGMAARCCDGEFPVLPGQYELSPLVLGSIAGLWLALGLLGFALRGGFHE